MTAIAADSVRPYVERIHVVYPDLAIHSAMMVEGHGQNNAILIVNGDTVYRFPLYASGVARLERLVRILPVVGQSVSLKVPKPTCVALDDLTPGHAFVGYPRISGQPLWRETFDDLPDESVRQSLADQLADFLKQLHAIPPEHVLPDEARAFDPLVEWADLYHRTQRKLFSEMRPDARSTVARKFEAFLADPQNRSIQPALIHGDFGTSNILFDPVTNRLSGVLDFDSARVGDPATDLAAASCYGIDRLTRVYPDADTARSRIAFYVSTFALQEALFGVENGDEDAFTRGIAAYR